MVSSRSIRKPNRQQHDGIESTGMRGLEASSPSLQEHGGSAQTSIGPKSRSHGKVDTSPEALSTEPEPSLSKPSDEPMASSMHSPVPTEMPAAQISPSSSTAGFFQPTPQLNNLYTTDPVLPRALSLFLPASLLRQTHGSLVSLADAVVTPEIQAYMLSAENTPPYVQQFSTFGRRVDKLITSEGWRGLQNWGIKEGMVALPYENTFEEYTRVLWAARYAIWAGSACWVNCPGLMVDGVASALRRYLTPTEGGPTTNQPLMAKREVALASAYEKLVSRELTGNKKAWTTGQWMTERQGGSDVSMTETVATWDPEGAKIYNDASVRASDGMELGPWRLDGFKWFSSATDADMVVLLARTAKGVGLFFAPMRRTLKAGSDLSHGQTELNGVSIQRLKNKLGTRALPTAELELKGMRGWLVGEEGRGTKEIATVLNIARMHNGLTAIGLWGRGLAIVRAFARVRVVGRRPLWERTGYMRTLSRMHAEYRANVLFNFFVAGLLGCVEQTQVAAFKGMSADTGLNKIGCLPGVKDTVMAEWLLRVLTPALKGHCSKTAISGLQECMECLGGVGYLENDDPLFNVARLYRDANVLPIWEGTTDMMADDTVIRVLFGKTRDPVMQALKTWVSSLLDTTTVYGKQSTIVRKWWDELISILQETSKELLEMQARPVMDRLVDIVQGLLLLTDAARDGEEIAVLAMQAWFDRKQQSATILETSETWKVQVADDLKIVFGQDGPKAHRARL